MNTWSIGTGNFSTESGRMGTGNVFYFLNLAFLKVVNSLIKGGVVRKRKLIRRFHIIYVIIKR